MVSETSWLERVLIALSQSDINLLNEYSTLTNKLRSVQKCSDEEGLILLLVDKRKLFRDFRDESQQTLFLWIVRNKNKYLVALK